jgi:hypothetical protein
MVRAMVMESAGKARLLRMPGIAAGGTLRALPVLPLAGVTVLGRRGSGMRRMPGRLPSRVTGRTPCRLPRAATFCRPTGMSPGSPARAVRAMNGWP